MNAVAWIVLGGVLAFLALVFWFGHRVDQAARSIAGIAEVVKRASDKEAG